MTSTSLHFPDWEVDPNSKVLMEQIPLDRAFYMEDNRAVSFQGGFAIVVDDFEQLLKEMVEKTKSP